MKSKTAIKLKIAKLRKEYEEHKRQYPLGSASSCRGCEIPEYIELLKWVLEDV